MFSQIRNIIRRMTRPNMGGSEDPAVPLVNANGRFPKYMETNDDEELERKPHKLTKRSLRFEHVGHRLARRKELFAKRKIICDFALLFALVGIVLMVIETELYEGIRNENGKRIYEKDGLTSILIKSFISITTAILLGFIAWYHWLDIQLFMIDNGLDDWRLALTRRTCVKIMIELLICAIHPIPGDYRFEWTTIQAYSQKETNKIIPIDVMISLPMFLRLYLVCRAVMLHSKLYTDASSQSLGALNRINFNFRFIFKSYMTLYPEYVLALIMVSVFVIFSWALRACEIYHDATHANFFNSMWLIAITFLSIGYGDIVPNSYCGRGITVLTGMFGAGCTALVVAVLARKLELSRSEKYVHNFVIDVELDKKQKHAAANVLKQGWMIYKAKKRGKTGDGQLRAHQSKLLQAVHNIREVKTAQRRLADNSVSMVEMYRSQQTTCDAVARVYQRQDRIESTTDEIKATLNDLKSMLGSVHSVVTSQR